MQTKSSGKFLKGFDRHDRKEINVKKRFTSKCKPRSRTVWIHLPLENDIGTDKWFSLSVTGIHLFHNTRGKLK
jgi:hypothetical protein